MATLLHIDSSLNGNNSVSRSVTAAFREEWEAQHPNGTVIYRDLAATPVPHLDQLSAGAGFAAPDSHSPEQAEAFAVRTELADELEKADAIVIGAPMYNFTVPSTLKAWIDQTALGGRTIGPEPSAKGTPVVVVASRGGSYAPGTPREGFEFVQTYLEKALGGLFGLEVEFIVPELTLARVNPAMADLVEQSDASRAKADEEAVTKAKTLAARFAA